MGAGLLGYIVRRLLWAIPVLIAISFLSFLVLRMAPGDPVDTILGSRYQEDEAAKLRAKYGYDQPILQQYLTYMGNLVRGDLGISTQKRDFTVAEVIFPRMWVSARLNAMGLVIGLAIGITVGVYAAMARGTFLDPLIIGFWLAVDAIPTQVWMPLVTWLFALQLGLVKLGYDGLDSPNIIPAVLILGLLGISGTARFMRASILQVQQEDYVRTARAKGLKERQVVMTHIARNALLPMVTSLGLSLPGLVVGSVFVEVFFGIPGMGNELLAASLAPDYDVVLALVMITSAIFVLANILIDITYAFLDPRIRLGAERSAL